MFQDIINYGNRQGRKQAIADFGLLISELINCGFRNAECGIEGYGMCDGGYEISNRIYWIRRMQIAELKKKEIWKLRD
jgi:hypothetical protein